MVLWLGCVGVVVGGGWVRRAGGFGWKGKGREGKGRRVGVFLLCFYYTGGEKRWFGNEVGMCGTNSFSNRRGWV